jgi:NADPH-dependent 2,4-dienoyl-CoA reductase/sulfur reductase-like enzyme/rhodanese-related sulfurtransferase
MPTKFVVVGGVAAGASAATRARRLDENAEIVVFEKSGHVSFANCGLPYHIGNIIEQRSDLILVTPQRFAERFNIDVRIHHEVLQIDRAGKRVRVKNHETGEEFWETYDKLLLSPGAAPFVPPIEGVDSENVFGLRNIEDMDAIRKYIKANDVQRVAIIGAGFIGLEVAESLKHRGIAVDVIEMMDQVLPPLDPDMAHMVASHLKEKGVSLTLGDGLGGFKLDGGKVTSVVTQSGREIPADLVLMSIGVRPSSELAREAGLELNGRGAIKVNERLETSDPDIYAAGDAVEGVCAITGRSMFVPLAGPASKHGRLAGQLAVNGGGPAAAKVAGTAIVKVFDLTAAATGMNVKTAERQGMDCAYVIARRPHHVSYYPGATPMFIKLVFAPQTGKVLGAQIVGGAGVDRRIDIIATVIHFGGTIDDLAQLDLAYSPQYGAAKDPVHIAAMIAQNQRDGLVRHVDPGEVANHHRNGVQLIDVSSPEEFLAGTIPGAKNVPIDELRNRLDELDPSRPVLVFCAYGQRAYLAYRILTQRGFTDVTSVAGGLAWYQSRGLQTA